MVMQGRSDKLLRASDPPRAWKICVVGSGDTAKAAVVHFLAHGLEVVWTGSNPKLPIKAEYLGDPREATEADVIRTDYDSVHREPFDAMFVTYPHMVLEEKMPKLFSKPMPHLRAVYFMFTFGDAMKYIPRLAMKYPAVDLAVGNFSFFHAKTKLETVHITKLMPSQYYLLHGEGPGHDFVKCLSATGFKLQRTQLASDIFLNCTFYSNMIWHPSLWYAHFLKDPREVNDLLNTETYLYRDISLQSWRTIYQIWNEIKQVGQAMDCRRPTWHDRIIGLVARAFTWMPNFSWLDTVLLRYNHSQWPWLSMNYHCDAKVKRKHFERDVIHGLLFCLNLGEHLEVRMPYLTALVEEYRGLQCFCNESDAKLFETHADANFPALIQLSRDLNSRQK
eukprot:CAMPEP_0172679568 /NCGR_PEP_ID=MMETSP1074-20121228/16153_1 /TAXON_ID=2916 /ORGANISM="Ceratium fusus, Strain PA161109" /LENGTH=391 /DNA_ID=CAMNT_0013497757 /DNA_START=24 /DNA_END=1199 /DNA_ORIENTATION=-